MLRIFSMFPPLVAILSLVLIAPHLAQAAVPPISRCTTQFGKASVRVVPTETTTVTSTITLKVNVFSSPVKTVSGPRITKTTKMKKKVVRTRTADPTETVIETSYNKKTEIKTMTNTIVYTTRTSVTTTTTSLPTITIPTTAGFTPIKSVAGNPPARKRDPAILPEGEAKENMVVDDLHEVRRAVKSYATSVICGVTSVISTTVTVTQKAPKTIIKTGAGLTSWKTILSTSTEETVVYPDGAISTSIESLATTVTQTFLTEGYTITTTTSTQTATASPSVYPGCSADNILSSRNGFAILASGYIDKSNFGTPKVYYPPVISTAEDCCQRCQREPMCLNFWFLPGQFCTNYIAQACRPGVHNMDYYAPNSNRAPYFTIGNGHCGIMKWNGDTVVH